MTKRQFDLRMVEDGDRVVFEIASSTGADYLCEHLRAEGLRGGLAVAFARAEARRLLREMHSDGLQVQFDKQA